MTSFGAGCNTTVFGFTTSYKIQGKVYHLMGSLMPSSDKQQPKFDQIYFMGSREQQAQLLVDNSPGSLNAIITR